jgi:hypothetical protein
MPKAKLFSNVQLVLRKERRCLRLGEDVEVLGHDLDLSGRKVGIDGRSVSPRHPAANGEDPFRADVLCRGGNPRGTGPDDDLSEAPAVPEIDERDAPQIPDAVHPTHEDDVLSGVRGFQFATRMGPFPVTHAVRLLSSR